MGRETDPRSYAGARVQHKPRAITGPHDDVLQAVHVRQAVRGYLHPVDFDMQRGSWVRMLSRGGRDGRQQQRRTGAMRTALRAIVIVLLGAAAMATKCEAATFTCTDVGTDTLTCFCRADQSLCGEMGDCMQSCPLPD